MIDIAKPFASRSATGSGSVTATAQAIAAKAELTRLVERARDERFRLLKMLKDARAEADLTSASLRGTPTVTAPEKPALAERVAASPSTTQTQFPTERIAHLLDKLAALDAAMDAKLERMNDLARRHEARVGAVEAALERSLHQSETMLAAGRLLHGELMAAVRDAHGLPTRIIEQLDRFDQHLASYAKAGRAAFEADVEQLRASVVAETCRQLSEAGASLSRRLADADELTESEVQGWLDAMGRSLRRDTETVRMMTGQTTRHLPEDRAVEMLPEPGVLEAKVRAHELPAGMRLPQRASQGSKRVA